MNKLIKYAPIATAVAWLCCIVIGVFCPNKSYRYEFIFAAFVLVLTNVFLFTEGNRNDRETKGSDDEHGSESESDNNNQ